MTSNFPRSVTILAYSMAFIAGSALLNSNNPFGISSAYAGNADGNGNGNGNGNGSGNGNGNGGGGNGNGGNVSGDSGKGQSAKLGALNADHASAKTLARAPPNSRIGKIAAYRNAQAVALAAGAAVTAATHALTTIQATAAAALAAYNKALADAATAAGAVTTAANALALAPGDIGLQNAVTAAQVATALADAAVATALVTSTDAAAAEAHAQAAVVAAAAAAATAKADAQAALDAAANKLPVTSETKTALDLLLARK